MTAFGGATPGDPLTMDPPKLIFRLAQTKVPVIFEINRYLTDKHFGIVWGCQPSALSQNGPPKKQLFERPNLRCHCFLISVHI